MTGQTNYKPSKDAKGQSYGDRMTFVGDVKSPLWFGKRRDVQKLLNDGFWTIYDKWRYHHNGIPCTGDSFTTRCVIALEELYKARFSAEYVQLQYAEAIIERLNAMLKRR